MEFKSIEQARTATRANYDRMSRWYDWFGSFESAYRNAGLRALDVQEGEMVLEIGFGTGPSVVMLAKAVGNLGKVYGIDLSPAMRNLTQTRIDQAGLSHRVDLHCGDALQLPYADDFFDAIFMSFTLELFGASEIPAVLCECRRVLKERGRICVVALRKEKNKNAMTRLYEWAHTRFPQYIDCRPIAVEQMLNEAGLAVVEAVRMTLWGLPVAVVLAKNEKN